MNKIRMLFIVMGCFIYFPAYSGSGDITYPKAYETEFLNYLSVDRSNNFQTARIYANITAMVGVQRFGDFPDGSVLVMEISKVKKSAAGTPLRSKIGRLINDGKTAVYVMQKVLSPKNKSVSGENGDNWDWQFAAFTPDGKAMPFQVEQCRSCHAPLKKKKYVFSYDHLEKSDLYDYVARINKQLENEFKQTRKKEQVQGPLKSKGSSVREVSYDQHQAINKVIEKQLSAFRNNNAPLAYSLAAPGIRKNFHNPEYFMHVVRVAYPVILKPSSITFPDLRSIEGEAFSQVVVLKDREGKSHRVRYMMLKVDGKWKIAGCSIL